MFVWLFYVKEKWFNFEGVEVISVWVLRYKLLEIFFYMFIVIIYVRLFVRFDIVYLYVVGFVIFMFLVCLFGMKVMVMYYGVDYDR